MLDDTLQLLEPQLRRSQIELVRRYDKDAPEAYANAGKLQQVFTNLILNARDAIPDGGRIIVATGTAEDGSLLVEITDTGIGIAPENVAKIYDPFYTTKGVGQEPDSVWLCRTESSRNTPAASVSTAPRDKGPPSASPCRPRVRTRLQAVGD